jgi:hypothetical protein
MRILIWNIRGLGKLARVRQLGELMRKERVDYVGASRNYQAEFHGAGSGENFP